MTPEECAQFLDPNTPLFSDEERSQIAADEKARRAEKRAPHHEEQATHASKENSAPPRAIVPSVAPRAHMRRREVGTVHDDVRPDEEAFGRGPRAKPDQLLCRIAEIPIKPIEWIWYQRIAAGTLANLDGDPGLGKSTLVADLIARITRGESLYGDSGSRSPADVILISYEDSPGTVIRPRLMAAGADLDRVHTWKLDVTPFTLPGSLDRLDEYIREHRVSLVVIDPLMAALSSRVDAHRDQDIRRVLAKAASIAERTGAAILFVRHLNKRQGEPALYRGGGSIGIIGAVRSGLLLVRDPNDADARILAMTKSNMGRQAPSLRLRLVTAPPPAPGVEVAIVRWEGECGVTADDLMAPVMRGRPREDAKELLRSLLRDGPVPAAEILAQAKAAGVSTRTLERVKGDLGVQSRKVDDGWIWSLPTEEGGA
jgi:hypothetical protein